MTSRSFAIYLLTIWLLTLVSLALASVAQNILPPPQPPILLPGQEAATPEPSSTPAVQPSEPSKTAASDPSSSRLPPADVVSEPSPEPSPPPQPSPDPAPAKTIDEPRRQADQVQANQNPPSPELVESRLNRIEARLAGIEERLSAPVVKEIPAETKSGYSTKGLFALNAVTFALVVYLLWKSRGASRPFQKKEDRPLRNVKDYMRRYLAQGYRVSNMKTYLINQGYPKDLVERAAREMEAEGLR